MLLKIQDLSIKFATNHGTELTAVRGLHMNLQAGETLAVVGESGCGKSITNLALMGLLPPTARVEAACFELAGQNLLGLNAKGWQKVRGSQVAMIFQDPMSALNPSFTVGNQLDEAIALHQGPLSAKSRQAIACELLGEVGIPDPANRLACYPHELSGGMAQRVMIAMALACKPKLLIADEPTTALDVTIQDQILKLLKSLQARTDMAMILVTHDLAVAAQHADRLQVMYAGEVVESGEISSVLHRPSHPYTIGLLNSLPSQTTAGFRSRLRSIPGTVPALGKRPAGCQFSTRCSVALPRCHNEQPSLRLLRDLPGRQVSCFIAQKEPTHGQ